MDEQDWKIGMSAAPPPLRLSSAPAPASYPAPAPASYPTPAGSNGTYTEGTGPQFDHTLNDERGHFMYLDASVGDKNHTAVLQSPIFNISELGTDCTFKFWYHMLGRHTEKLAVEINSSQTRGEFRQIWQRLGEVDSAEQGYDRWRHGQHSLARYVGGLFAANVEGLVAASAGSERCEL